MYEKYAQLRDARGITDYEVAKSTGISTATLTNWKQGNYAPKADKLIKIADYFGVTLDYLVRKSEKTDDT